MGGSVAGGYQGLCWLGSLRPSASIDISASYELWRKELRSLRVQADLFNLGNRLNVINFAGVFSGTALASGRNLGLRLQATF